MEKNEMIKNLKGEDFCLKYLNGTKMPNSRQFIEITVFENVFFIEDENGEKEYRDKNKIWKIKNIVEKNIEKIDNIIQNSADPIKSSFNNSFSIQINNKHYSINKNASNEEGKRLFDEFCAEFINAIDFKNLNSTNVLIQAINEWRQDERNVNKMVKMFDEIKNYSFLVHFKNGNQIATLTNKNSEKFLPIFTSESELKKFIRDNDGENREWNIFHSIKVFLDESTNFKSIVIDPFGINFPIDEKVANYINTKNI